MSLQNRKAHKEKQMKTYIPQPLTMEALIRVFSHLSPECIHVPLEINTPENQVRGVQTGIQVKFQYGIKHTDAPLYGTPQGIKITVTQNVG